MSLTERLTAAFGDEVADAEEETFLLYSQPIASQNLGFVDPKAASVEVVVGGREYTVHQSPAVLSSSRAGGTTGAVLWKVTPLFADYLSAPANPLLALLPPRPAVLELGCGISPLAALALRPVVSSYVLSDQPYVQRLVAQNLAANPPPPPPRHRKGGGAGSSRTTTASSSSSSSSMAGDVRFRVLDWETDAVTGALAAPARSFDAVLACDCVYNHALVEPLVQTCADACALRARDESGVEERQPCVCIVAQQLRDDDVFLCWLTAFQRRFRVWQLPPDMLPAELRPAAGFVVHVGVLRDARV